MEAKWLHDPYLLKVPTGGRSQSGYITRAFSGSIHAQESKCLHSPYPLRRNQHHRYLKGQPQDGEIKWTTFVIAFLDSQHCFRNVSGNTTRAFAEGRDIRKLGCHHVPCHARSQHIGAQPMPCWRHRMGSNKLPTKPMPSPTPITEEKLRWLQSPCPCGPLHGTPTLSSPPY